MFGLFMVSCQKEEATLIDTEQVSVDDAPVYELELPNPMSEKEAVKWILNMSEEEIEKNKQEVESPTDYSLKNCRYTYWTTYNTQWLCNHCSGNRSAVRTYQYRLYLCNGEVFRWQLRNYTNCNTHSYC